MPDWPHGPLHRIAERGIYFITAGTYLKEHYYRDASALNEFQELLFSTTQEHRVDLHACALLSNHYHLILETEQSLQPFFRHLHSLAARERNLRDGVEGRKVWFQYRDTQLTYERCIWLGSSTSTRTPFITGLCCGRQTTAGAWPPGSRIVPIDHSSAWCRISRSTNRMCLMTSPPFWSAAACRRFRAGSLLPAGRSKLRP